MKTSNVLLIALVMGFLQGCESINTSRFNSLTGKVPTQSQGQVAVKTGPAPTSACPSGGTLIITFSDINANSILDANETVLNQTSVCNGAPAAVVDSAINSNWTPVTDTQVNPILATLDLSSVGINSLSDGNAIWGCSGSYGNNIVNNGVLSGNVRVTGTKQRGTIQFGNLKYYNSGSAQCTAASKEAYSYSIVGNKLTLCLVNLNYPYCSDYTTPATN